MGEGPSCFCLLRPYLLPIQGRNAFIHDVEFEIRDLNMGPNHEDIFFIRFCNEARYPKEFLFLVLFGCVRGGFVSGVSGAV